MPELPETETIARDLDREVRGRIVERVEVTRADVLREVDASELAVRVRGARIVGAWRRAKLVVLDLSTRDRLVVQPRFTGALLIDDGTLAEEERRYSTLALHLDDGRLLHYRDIRRLGTVTLMDAERFEAYSASLGAEPLDASFTASQLSALLRTSRQAIKKVLMDQRVVVGVGNIYANESLWLSGVDPSRPARSLAHDEIVTLHRELRAVLERSIAARGTSFRDYRDATGGRGAFVDQLQAYGRGGEPCARCGHALVETHEIDGRSSVFCWSCQR